MSTGFTQYLAPAVSLMVGATLSLSESVLRILNEPVPEWLAVGEPVKGMPSEHGSDPDSQSFFPRSGGATNSRNVIKIPERGIELKVPYVIDWTGLTEEGYGVSLHPEGTKLLVNTGMTTRLYEISSSGAFQEVPINVPHLTYDQAPKGFILRWSWAGDEILIGEAAIESEAGEFIEKRIYVFNLKGNVLRRLDLSALKLATTEGLTVTQVGTSLDNLKLSTGDTEFTVSADLKSPPRLMDPGHREAAPAPMSLPEIQPSTLGKVLEPTPTPETLSGETTSSTRWSVLAVLIIAAIVLLWLFLKKPR